MEKDVERVLPDPLREGHELTQPFARANKVETPLEFLSDFSEAATHASERIWVKVMHFNEGHAPGVIEHVLEDGAKRGLDTRAYLDWFTIKATDDWARLFPPLAKAEREHIKEIRLVNRRLRERLNSSGVKVEIENSPGVIGDVVPQISSYVKRDHRKAFVVDNVAWVGGISLADFSFKWADFLVRLTNPGVVAAVAEQFTNKDRRHPSKDYSIDCDPHFRLLVDSGKVGKSIIYREAVEMVNNADEQIVYVSRVVPDGPLLQAIINKAKSGVPGKIITSSKEIYRNFPPFQHALKKFKKAVAGEQNIRLVHDPENEVHAKLLLTDDKGLFGSHNFTRLSILAGTDELDLRTDDPDVVRQLYGFADGLEKKAVNV